MLKKLQRYVPKDVKEAVQQARTALAQNSVASGSVGAALAGLSAHVPQSPASAGSHATSSAVAGAAAGEGAPSDPPFELEEEDNIFEIGDEEDLLAPMFEPFADEVPLFDVNDFVQTLRTSQGSEPSNEAAGAPAGPAATAVAAVAAYSGVSFDREALGEGPIAAILVVDFHHLHGPVVEWLHPEICDSGSTKSVASAAEEVPDYPDIDIWAAPAQVSVSDVARIVPLVSSLALPDAAHRERSDETSSVFFLLPCGEGLLYGISCHRRQSDATVHRSAVQKAVCVLSRCPFFGLMQQRLSPVTQAFFEQKDFSSTSLLSGFYSQLNAIPFERLSESELFHGLDHTPYLRALKSRLLSLLKAILLECKVLVIAQSAETCSRAVLCLLSLLPGGLWFSFNSDGLGSRHFHFRKYGLPLRCFGSRCCVYPYLGLQMLDSLLQMRGFLIGTTNRLIEERAAPDVVLEVFPDEAGADSCPNAGASGAGSSGQPPSSVGTMTCSLTIHSKELRKLVECSPSERKWLDEEVRRVEAAAPRAPQAPAQEALGPNGSATAAAQAADSTQAEKEQPSGDGELSKPGTDEDARPADAAPRQPPREASSSPWTRLQDLRVPQSFSRFAPLNRSLGAPIQEEDAGQALLRETSWAAAVDASRAAFALHWDQMLARTAYHSGADRNFAQSLESASREEKAELSRFGLGFLQRWTSQTSNGRLWQKAHRLPAEKRQRPPREGSGTYRFNNGDEYRGEFRRGVRHGAGVYVGARKRLHYDGQWQSDVRSGSGTLTIEGPTGQVHYTYDGQWSADQRHGSGSSIRRGSEKYSGQWARNVYHGAGTFVDGSGILYEGEWCEGRFDGMGKLVQKGDTYTGEFRAGRRHGMGQLVQQQHGSSKDAATTPVAAPAQEGGSSGSRSPPALCPTPGFSPSKGRSRGGYPDAQAGSPEPITSSMLAAELGERSVLGQETLFAGQWHEGERHGQGRALFVNGEYEGGWLAGHRHGQGMLANDGFQLEGPWSLGAPDEAGVHMLFAPCGSKYTGGVRSQVCFVDCPEPQPRTPGSAITPAGGTSSIGSDMFLRATGSGGSATRPGFGPDPGLGVGEAEGAVPADAADPEPLDEELVWPGSHWWVVPDGQGLMKTADGRLYEGQHFSGRAHGQGVLTLPGQSMPLRVFCENGIVRPVPDQRPPFACDSGQRMDAPGASASRPDGLDLSPSPAAQERSEVWDALPVVDSPSPAPPEHAGPGVPAEPELPAPADAADGRPPALGAVEERAAAAEAPELAEAAARAGLEEMEMLPDGAHQPGRSLMSFDHIENQLDELFAD